MLAARGRGLLPVALLSLSLVAIAGRAAAADDQTLRLITTTTTENSGLMAYLIPVFERESGFRVQVIAVGTGRALKLLARGDADVALTHARHLEQRLIDAGSAVGHLPVMQNDFILVGPAADPAGAAASAGIVGAFAAIAQTRSLFVSRGDQSGTHVREQQLWNEAGVEPGDDWYRLAGQGMGKTLLIAGELGAYALIDRGTWLAYRGKSPLGLIFEGGEFVLNEYSVLSANPVRYPEANSRGARAFTAWIRSQHAKQLIREFVVDGQPLFVPVP
jgi:tungstate transport system substrate-binding protein